MNTKCKITDVIVALIILGLMHFTVIKLTPTIESVQIQFSLHPELFRRDEEMSSELSKANVLTNGPK